MFPEKTDFQICAYSPIEKGKKKKYYKHEPYLCPKCKKVWQPSTKSWKYQENRPEYLYGFPKYGCCKLVCKPCL